MRILNTVTTLLCALLVLGPAIAQTGPTLVPESPKVEQRIPIAPPAQNPRELTAMDLETWLDGFMSYALQRGGVAGGVVSVVKDGQLVLAKGYGWADVEKRKPVVADRTLFRPGSVSKLFTWTAMMQLVEQGKIDLDKDVNAYLDFKIPPRNGKPITIRDIMTHTPGFEERVKGLITPDIKNLQPLDTYIPAWIPDRIYDPGTTPAYSNYATGLAGYIVQRVSGEQFEAYIERHILAPLGMADSTFRQPLPAPLRAHMSKGYSVRSEPAEEYELVNPAPAGSLASTAADMAKFMIAHLQDGRYGNAQILRPQTAQLMHDTGRDLLPPLNRMMLGFYESKVNGHRVIAHGGDTQWFHSDLSLFIDDGVGLFISLNSAGEDGATSAIRQALLQEFADRYLPGPRLRPGVGGRVDPKVAKKHAAMMAGVYDSSRTISSSFLAALNLLGQTKVANNGDGTITIAGVDDLAGAPKVWQEIAPFVWQEKGGDERLAARIENGKVTRFATESIAPIIIFLPTPWWRSSAWLLPLVYASLFALLLTALLWPTAALVRRRYQAPFALQGADRQAYRWLRIGASASLLVLSGWAALVIAISEDTSLFSSAIDPWAWLLQIASLIVFVGTFAAALWNIWRVWNGGSRWPAKVWSIVLVIASLTLLWVALAFHLIGFTTNF